MARQFLKVTVKQVDGRDVSQHIRLLPIDKVVRVQPADDANDSEVFVKKQGIAPTKLVVDETVSTLDGQIPAGFKLLFVAVAKGAQKYPSPLSTLVFTPNLIECRQANGSGAVLAVTRTLQTVTSIAVTTAGEGYTVGATVAITGGGGSGATAVPVVENGMIVGVQVTAVGSGYTSNPTATIVPGSKVLTNESGAHFEDYTSSTSIAALETDLTP